MSLTSVEQLAAARAGLRFRVIRTEASYVVVPEMEGREEQLAAGQSPATVSDWGVEPEHRRDASIAPDGRNRSPPNGEPGTCFPRVRRGGSRQRPVPVDPWDAVATAEVLDAARRSASTGQVVPIKPAG